MMGNNGQKPNIGQAAVPIIQAMTDVNCWCCNRAMKVPAEMVKKVKRVVCQTCAQDFDAFLWSFYKSAREAKMLVDNIAKKAENGIEKGETKASDPVSKI